MAHFADLSGYSDEEMAFWDTFCTYANKVFKTARGLEFHYRVKGNEVFIDRKKKSVTRSAIMKAYRVAMQMKAEGIPVNGPKKLQVFGASYIYPILKAMTIL